GLGGAEPGIESDTDTLWQGERLSPGCGDPCGVLACRRGNSPGQWKESESGDVSRPTGERIARSGPGSRAENRCGKRDGACIPSLASERLGSSRPVVERERLSHCSAKCSANGRKACPCRTELARRIRDEQDPERAGPGDAEKAGRASTEAKRDQDS